MNWRLIAAGVLSVLMAGSCTREKEQENYEKESLVRCTFTASVKQHSKSLLTSEDIEDRIENLLLAVYIDGELFYWKYYGQAPEEMEIMLHQGRLFKIYAAANISDASASLPQKEKDLHELVYTIDSYNTVNESGMPMAGMLCYRPGTSINSQIQLERLFARVTVNLNCKWPGGKIQSARLSNMNGSLRPFGESAIEGIQDVYSGPEECAQTNNKGVTLELYVPENMQGVIDGISSSDGKSPDKNGSVKEKEDRLTYLEVQVSGSGLYEGTMTYRNYLGNNATDSFDICRNTSYVWNIEYYEDNLSRDEWKYENDLTDNRFLNTDDRIYVIPGQTVSLSDCLDSNLDPSTLAWEPIGSSNGIVILNSTDLSQPSFRVKDNAEGGTDIQLQIYPKHNKTAPLVKSLTVMIKEPLQLDLKRQDNSQAFPYQMARYMSTARMSSQKAVQLCAGLNLEVSSENTVQELQKWDYGQDSEGYYIILDVIPTLPGKYDLTAVSDSGIERFSLNVSVPELSTGGKDEIVLDMHGYDNPVTLSLCDSLGTSIQDGVYVSNSKMSLSLDTGSGTDVFIGYNSNGGNNYTTTIHNYSVMLKGFSGLSGMDSHNWTFKGISIPATASYTYPNGFKVQKAITITIRDPFSTLDGYDGQTCHYRVDMGISGSNSYVTSMPELYPEYMLEWPARSFHVDLTRGGKRAVPETLKFWGGAKSHLTPSRYSISNGKVSFTESLGEWGPMYFGTSIKNQHSGETVYLWHSVVSFYNHYNVFACFDVKQDNAASMGADWGDIDWNSGSSKWGCMRVSVKNNFSKGPYKELLSPLILKNVTSSTEAGPVFSAYTKGADGHSYSSPPVSGYPGRASYQIGYDITNYGYDIYYSVPEIMQYSLAKEYWPIINWRVMAAANSPKYKAGPGGHRYGSIYCSPLKDIGNGTYNFSIVSASDYNNNQKEEYLDLNGNGYQYLHLFWEGKVGLRTFPTKKLNALKYPVSRPTVTLVNGWYDPSLYYSLDNDSNGIPLAAQGNGMYFFSSTYYTYDNYTNFMKSFNGIKPTPEFLNTFEWLGFGTLAARDKAAPRD